MLPILIFVSPSKWYQHQMYFLTENTQFYSWWQQRKILVIEKILWLYEIMKSDTCWDCKQQADFKTPVWFIVQTFSVTVDSWNENGHFNSALNANGVQCSVLTPLVTESSCKFYTLPHPKERVRMTHQAFLPKLCSSKQRYIRMHIHNTCWCKFALQDLIFFFLVHIHA